MIDWTKSMKQTFEFFEVDPSTWENKRVIDTVESASVKFDLNSDSIATANVTLTELIGEAYIRIYLVATQNDIEYRYCFGTYLLQTPSYDFDGKNHNVSVDAYSPLIELKEKYVPNGYTILKNSPIVETVADICRGVIRAPVIDASTEKTMTGDFISSLDNTYLDFLTDALDLAEYRFNLDDRGRVLFSPYEDTASLRAAWIFNDNNSSILYPEVKLEKDIYSIPNVVEALYSEGSGFRYSRVENHEEGNPMSIENRGREIVYRDSNPSFSSIPTQAMLDDYAKNLLAKMSTVECSITYKHGYCPVRVGDGVILNYEKAGLENVRAKVVSQNITCEPGCPVEEKAVFSSKMWNVT